MKKWFPLHPIQVRMSFPPRIKYGVNSGGNPYFYFGRIRGLCEKLDSCFRRNDKARDIDYHLSQLKLG